MLVRPDGSILGTVGGGAAEHKARQDALRLWNGEDVPARQVYDQDNKAWKAISNALKGRVVADDDQYSLGVCLLSRRSSEAECHIYVLPVQDAGDFFFLRSDQYPFSR